MNAKGNTVLIIDDDSDSSGKIARAVEADGYMAFTAASGDVALTMAKKVKPGLVFLNLAAPRVNGLDICKDIHSIDTLSELPIILLTLKKGGFDPRYKEQYGIHGFLKKPFEPEEVKVSIESVFAPKTEDFDKAALVGEALEEEEISLDLGTDADSTMVMEGAPSSSLDAGAPEEGPAAMDFGGLDETDNIFSGTEDEELDTGIFEDDFHIEDEEHAEDHDKTMVMGVTEKPAPKPPAPKPPAPKPEPKAEVKPAPKSAPKPAPKVEPKPAPKPAPKAEVKPAPKAAPKPAPQPAPAALPKFEEEPSFGGIGEDIDTEAGGMGKMADIDFGSSKGEEGYTGAIEDVLPTGTPEASEEEKYKAGPGVYVPKKRLRVTQQSLMPVILGVLALIVIAGGIGTFLLLRGGKTQEVSQLAMIAPSRPMAKPKTSEPSLVAEATAAAPPAPAAKSLAPALPAAKAAPATKPPVPAPKPVVIAPPAGKPGMYYVQYGLFKNAGNADRLTKDLKSKGLTASIMREGDLNRVVGDSFTSKSDAREKAAGIKSAHNIATAVYLVKGESPIAVAAPKAAPAPSAGAALTQKYYVQFGAFGVKANAERLAAKLRGMGIEAFIYFDSGRNLSLVLADGYSTLSDAQSRAKTIKETNGVDTSVYKSKG